MFDPQPGPSFLYWCSGFGPNHWLKCPCAEAMVSGGLSLGEVMHVTEISFSMRGALPLWARLGASGNSAGAMLKEALSGVSPIGLAISRRRRLSLW